MQLAATLIPLRKTAVLIVQMYVPRVTNTIKLRTFLVIAFSPFALLYHHVRNLIIRDAHHDFIVLQARYKYIADEVKLDIVPEKEEMEILDFAPEIMFLRFHGPEMGLSKERPKFLGLTFDNFVGAK